MKTTATILALSLALAVCAHAKPKKEKDNDVGNLIENVTGIDLNGKKGNKQLNQAINALTGSDSGKKKTKGGNSANPGNLGNLASLDTIRQYITGYRSNNNTRNLPPGLAKKVARGGDLPPGWQKKVSRGNTFPGDLWPFTSPVNYNQVPRFGDPGDGIDIYSIGNRLFKLNRSDNRILDILDFG